MRSKLLLTNTIKAYHFLICGDFNTSFEINTAQTKSLNCFIELNNMRVAWKLRKGTLMIALATPHVFIVIS